MFCHCVGRCCVSVWKGLIRLIYAFNDIRVRARASPNYKNIYRDKLRRSCSTPRSLIFHNQGIWFNCFLFLCYHYARFFFINIHFFRLIANWMWALHHYQNNSHSGKLAFVVVASIYGGKIGAQCQECVNVTAIKSSKYFAYMKMKQVNKWKTIHKSNWNSYSGKKRNIVCSDWF